MGKFRGTKGEWKTDKDSVYSEGCESDGNIICEAPVSWDVSMRKWKYNAKLIAAAPEMLEQLKESIAVISWYMDNTKPENNQHSDFFNIGTNQRQQLEDLISKATE